MVDGMTLLNFNVVILHNLLRTVSACVDELVPQDNRVSCILHISLNILRGHLASTTCEPFVEEVTFQTIVCHISVTTLSIPGHGSLSQMN